MIAASPLDIVLSPDEVRERFRWARRQGHPSWLWPDIAVEEWRSALRSIEEAARACLSGEDSAGRLDGPPAAMGLGCYTSGLGPLLGWWCDQGRIEAPAAIRAMLALHLSHNRGRMARMTQTAREVIRSLRGQNIDVLLLKGLDTAHAYFPDPATRPASDIDLLVAAEDFERSETILRGAGFQAGTRHRRESNWRSPQSRAHPQTLMHVHVDDPWSIDLHNSLDVTSVDGAPVARLDRLKPLTASRPWAVVPEGRALSQPSLLLHLAVHAGAGLHNLTLLRIAELHLVIRRDSASGLMCWDAFVASARQCGALGYAYPALALCEALVPGHVPAVVREQGRLAAPVPVRRLVDRLTPASAQRVDRMSLAEHFMWTSGWRARARQIAGDLLPAAGSLQAAWAIYEKRAWRLIRGRISR